MVECVCVCGGGSRKRGRRHKVPQVETTLVCWRGGKLGAASMRGGETAKELRLEEGSQTPCHGRVC